MNLVTISTAVVLLAILLAWYALLEYEDRRRRKGVGRLSARQQKRDSALTALVDGNVPFTVRGGTGGRTDIIRQGDSQTQHSPAGASTETLMLRLKAFVAQDSRTIQVMAEQRGTRGKPREFSSLLTSPDRPLSNREIKQPILRLCDERFPLSPFIGYIHRDTDDAHGHGWLSALQTNGLKLHIGKEKVDGEWVDRFKHLDEDYLRFYSEMVGDPSVLEEHLAKKAEWYEKKAEVKTALANGERPPALPFRERHLYDELGERRQRKERRELEAKGEDPGPKKPAAPVARCRSTWECAELWGKTLHAEARLRDARFRQEELDKLPWHVEVEVEGRR